MRGYSLHHPNIRRCLLLFRTFSLIAARTQLFHGDRMCTTSEHSPPEARITRRVHLPIVPTAASFQTPHSFALEKRSSRVVQCGQGSRLYLLNRSVTITNTVVYCILKTKQA